ncbi:hypothetical protein ACF3MZ_23205 [Paenibacillaceae bacterium WGS1546]|uniref:hypothetical protein n=1 Tax=Cohnella sp. WGS1546 TaxID=3366810 RepID=UPI00372D5571
MDFHCRACTMEMDHEAYMKFLIRHQGELGLPYPFAAKLGFIASPLSSGRAMLILSEEPYEIVGAVGFVYGTSRDNYEDRAVCQVEIAFLREEYRRTALFGRGLRELLALMREGEPNVERVQFYAAADDEERKALLSKLLKLPGSTMEPANGMSLYKLPFRELERKYSRRARSFGH